MAINNTGAMFKSFEFDGTDSRNFGVYITGSGVYNAPEREVEMISIPNRNGAFALDKGRFENIEITYPAGIYADTEADFAEAISDLRNFLCSKRGYCRLTDEYNPNEYRMAIYKSGLEVTPTACKAGEFEITFECMPQRFLTSGETKTTLTSPATVTNPTLFDAKPMIEATGYGSIDVNGYPLSVQNEELGIITLIELEQDKSTTQFNGDLVNAGDDIVVRTANASLRQNFYPHIVNSVKSALSITKSNANCSSYNIDVNDSGSVSRIIMQSGNVQFDAGTSGYINLQRQITHHFDDNTSATKTYQYRVAYDGDDTITLQCAVDGTWSYINGDIQSVTADSTVSALGNPTYLDCDTGDAYKIENGSIVSLNHLIDMGSNLPILNSGSNTITFDNTFTKIEIIPRWWKL